MVRMDIIAGTHSSIAKFLGRRLVWTRVDAARSAKRRRQGRTEIPPAAHVPAG